MFNLLKYACKIQRWILSPFYRQNWVKRQVSSLPLLLQKSSKPEVRFWVHSSTGCWFVFYCAYFLFGWFGFGGGGVGFFWEGYARQLVCMYEVNMILLSTDKTQKQNMDNHKCQEKKKLIMLWLHKITWESLPHSAYWVQLEDFESCLRKG